jgi:hypothetical protein
MLYDKCTTSLKLEGKRSPPDYVCRISSESLVFLSLFRLPREEMAESIESQEFESPLKTRLVELQSRASPISIRQAEIVGGGERKNGEAIGHPEKFWLNCFFHCCATLAVV